MARLEDIKVLDNSLPWSFDADTNMLRLASEAYRINLAHIFDPYLAVHTSAIEPLPHQISAVYQEMLSRLPLRYILADDPGAGKTIMTGLFLKELLAEAALYNAVTDYLTDKIRSLLGREEAVVTIHGGMLRDERRKVEELFKQDKEVRILIATDAVGEGINLQRAHLMINYDLEDSVQDGVIMPNGGKRVISKHVQGKTNAKLNSQMAARRAEELASRMQKRLEELETEKLISAMSPVVVGGALVIPHGLLNKLTGIPESFTADAISRREVELSAMKAVMEMETLLGYIPIDVSATKVGYDIESHIPHDKRDAGGATLRFIEVKGRMAGADTVTVTKNEILTALNKPDDYILAIVEVNGTQTKTVYLKKPFRERPDFAATSVNYNIGELMSKKLT